LTVDRREISYGPFVTDSLPCWKDGSGTEIIAGRTPSKNQIHQFPRTHAKRVGLQFDGSGRTPGIPVFGIADEPLTSNI
jgi:hypothetical protein